MKNNKSINIPFCHLYINYIKLDKHIQELQIIFNTGRKSVIKNLNKFGIPLRNPTEYQLTKDVRNKLSNHISLIERYKSGETASEIAINIGTTKKVILKILRSHNIEIKNSYPKIHLENLNKQWLADQYFIQNKSLDKISQELSISRMTLQRKMLKLGMVIKSPFEYNTSSVHIHTLIPILDKFGIKHQTSFSLEVVTSNRTFKYEIDEYLPEHKIFLEVQGDYWHGYTDRIDSIIAKNKARDKRKQKYLIDKFPDHSIVYIRDSEIFNGSAEHLIKDISNGIIPKTYLPD